MTDQSSVTTSQGAEVLGIPSSVIRKWKYRRKITPVGVLRGSGRGGGQPLYDLEELRPLAVRYLERAATRGVK